VFNIDQQEPQRLELAQLPTPLAPLDRLAAELGGADLWLKRDDLTGLEISGNKVRKLEYIIADALASDCDTIVTEGTSQSNHCRATAAVCAKLGLQAVLLFRPEPTIAPQGNHMLDMLFGAEMRTYSREQFNAESDAIIETVLGELREAGRSPRFTPMGASEPLGTWGYIRMMSEMREQLAEAEIGECDLVVAISSGGTYAGMMLGKWLCGLDGVTIHAVPVSDDVEFHQQNVLELCRQAATAHNLDLTIEASMLSFIDGYVGEGYAIPYAEALQTIQLLAHTEAILLDPVYTGKGFHAFTAGIRSGRFGKDRPAIYVHTGGIFSNFAWPERLIGGVA
jgi:D-cysteine desulfhydrase